MPTSANLLLGRIQYVGKAYTLSTRSRTQDSRVQTGRLPPDSSRQLQRQSLIPYLLVEHLTRVPFSLASAWLVLCTLDGPPHA